MISAKFLSGNVLLRGKQQNDAKNSKFWVGMPLNTQILFNYLTEANLSKWQEVTFFNTCSIKYFKFMFIKKLKPFTYNTIVSCYKLLIQCKTRSLNQIYLLTEIINYQQMY